MGLFGFGRKHHDRDIVDDAADEKTAERDIEDDARTQSDETVDTRIPDEPSFADESAYREEPDDEYGHRGEDYGPWDVDDEQVPDYDEYLDLGAYFLPFMQNIELRVKANRATQEVLGCTISYGSSSLEIEAFAAPKTMGMWDDVRDDLLTSHADASEHAGTFGTEIDLPVTVKGGNTVVTRIVGVDGPRWMLRGIFSGKAVNSDSDEAKALDGFFADIVVARGEEPLAPRDLIPMHAPVAPAERKAASQEENESDGEGHLDKIPNRPKGPFDSDQQTEVKTTLSRGPMFSEVR